ncbi:MAG: asparagine--tRNA ligase [Bdellovibrionales bacterium]|nr:asparagine--tRNA ligase [Bdellovibrionales bacterium]
MRIKEILASGRSETEAIGTKVVVQGWVRTRRDSKEFSFLEVNDGSCLANLQVIAERGLAEFEANVLEAHTGSAVRIGGLLTESPGKGQSVELRAETFELVGRCDPDTYPLQKKRHSNEFLRTIAHLRPRTNTFGAVFRVRSALSFAIHQFFNERGFLYLHTPIIAGQDCEGAGELFRVTTLPLESPPRMAAATGAAGAVDYTQDFFGTETHLTVSGQLQAEPFACAMTDVYTFGPTFRAENSNTPRHLAEFWMVEPEMAFCDLQQDASLAEDFLRYLIRHVLKHCEEDMAFFDKWIANGIIESLQKVADAAFERITYTEAVAALERSGKQFEFPVAWGADLQTEHERYLTDDYIGRPVFVTNYPKEIKAFYMRLDEGERTVAAMDLLVPRLGEIIGGSQREEREDVLLRRLAELQMEADKLWWYLDIRRFGSVPHAGFGLGFERMLMYLTGVSNIRDSIPFPRTPGNAEF